MPQASLHIAFASEAALDTASRGWLGEALETWGVRTQVVPVSEETGRQREGAQARQRMINVSGEDELSGDDVPTLSESVRAWIRTKIALSAGTLDQPGSSSGGEPRRQ